MRRLAIVCRGCGATASLAVWIDGGFVGPTVPTNLGDWADRHKSCDPALVPDVHAEDVSQPFALVDLDSDPA